MEEKMVMGFATVLIAKCSRNFTNEYIVEKLNEYKEYLTTQGVNAEIIEKLDKVIGVVPELRRMMTVFGNNGILNLVLNEKDEKLADFISSAEQDITVQVGNGCGSSCGATVEIKGR